MSERVVCCLMQVVARVEWLNATVLLESVLLSAPLLQMECCVRRLQSMVACSFAVAFLLVAG